MKKILGICLFILLVGCGDRKTPSDAENQSAVDKTEFSEELEIEPELKDYHSYELGELIKNLMIDESTEEKITTWQWDKLANDKKIFWITEGYQEQYDQKTYTSFSRREGIARVNLLGERVSYLRDRKYEAPWSIVYQGAEAKNGVTLIMLEPIVDEMVVFADPEPSLKQQNIKMDVICEHRTAGESVKVTALSLSKKHPLYLIDRHSGGSAGESRWLELSLQDLSSSWCANENTSTRQGTAI